MDSSSQAEAYRKNKNRGRRASNGVQRGSSPQADRFDSCWRMVQNPALIERQGERMNTVNELIIAIATVMATVPLVPVIAIVVASTIYTNKKCGKRKKRRTRTHDTGSSAKHRLSVRTFWAATPSRCMRGDGGILLPARNGSRWKKKWPG